LDIDAGSGAADAARVTLAELLVALVTFGLVAAAAVTLLDEGQRAWAFGAARAETQQSARVALARLTAEIRGAGAVVTASTPSPWPPPRRSPSSKTSTATASSPPWRARDVATGRHHPQTRRGRRRAADHQRRACAQADLLRRRRRADRGAGRGAQRRDRPRHRPEYSVAASTVSTVLTTHVRLRNR